MHSTVRIIEDVLYKVVQGGNSFKSKVVTRLCTGSSNQVTTLSNNLVTKLPHPCHKLGILYGYIYMYIAGAPKQSQGLHVHYAHMQKNPKNLASHLHKYILDTTYTCMYVYLPCFFLFQHCQLQIQNVSHESVLPTEPLSIQNHLQPEDPNPKNTKYTYYIQLKESKSKLVFFTTCGLQFTHHRVIYVPKNIIWICSQKHHLNDW